MKCEYCDQNIMKGDYYCSYCATPNPRHDLDKMREAVLGVAVDMGVDVEDAEGINGKRAWDSFCERMWPPKG